MGCPYPHAHSLVLQPELVSSSFLVEHQWTEGEKIKHRSFSICAMNFFIPFTFFS